MVKTWELNESISAKKKIPNMSAIVHAIWNGISKPKWFWVYNDNIIMISHVVKVLGKFDELRKAVIDSSKVKRE